MARLVYGYTGTETFGDGSMADFGDLGAVDIGSTSDWLWLVGGGAVVLYLFARSHRSERRRKRARRTARARRRR